MMLELENLTHRYGTETAVEDISFGIDAGELVALLGPSGCGKTTIVQAIAGHVRPTNGRVLLRGMDVTDRRPEARRVSVVFQQSTLFPHMTVSENVAYGLDAQGIAPDRRDERVAEYLQLVDLHSLRDAYPEALSGGQQRRAELARALAPQPDILLLDEPLSALDRGLRGQLRDEIASIQQETGVTTLFVTHDQEDAMGLADRLVVMNDGRVASTGEPRRLYQSPPNPFVASFLGRSNTLSGTVVGHRPVTVRVADTELPLDRNETHVPEGSSVTCHIRPDDIALGTPPLVEAAGTLTGEVVQVRDVGRRYDVTVRLPTGDELVVEQSRDPPAAGEACNVSVERQGVTLFGPADT